MAAMQCFDPIPDLQRRNRLISDRAASIVARCLQKNRVIVMPDASQLLRELDRYLDGAPSDFDAHRELLKLIEVNYGNANSSGSLKAHPVSFAICNEYGPA